MCISTSRGAPQFDFHTAKLASPAAEALIHAFSPDRLAVVPLVLLALATFYFRDVRRINSNVPPDLEALHRRIFDALGVGRTNPIFDAHAVGPLAGPSIIAEPRVVDVVALPPLGHAA